MAGNQTDVVRVQRAILVLFLFIVTVVLGFLGIKRGDLFIAFAIPIVLIFSKLMGNPSMVLMLSFFAWQAKFTVPGLPVNLGLFALLFLVGSSVLKIAMHKETALQLDTGSKRWAAGFLLVVAVTISIRGFGLRSMGSMDWGAKNYITILIMLFGYLFISERIALRPKQVRVLMGGLVACAALYWVVERGFLPGGRMFLIQVKEEFLRGVGPDLGPVRYEGARWLSWALFPFVVLLYERSRTFSAAGLFAVVLLLQGLSGYRSEIMALGLSLVAYALFFSSNKRTVFFQIGIAGAAGYIMLILLSDVLPGNIIRAVSFLPGVGDKHVAETAMGTIDWRIDIWRYAWAKVPEYFWIGRGLTFDVLSVAWLRPEFYVTPEYFFIAHGYHSGPLTLLVDFGIFGFVCMTSFFLVTSIRVVKLARDHILNRRADWGALCVLGYCARYVEQVFHFYAFYGDLGDMLIRMIMVLLIIEAACFGYKKYPLTEGVSE